MSRNSLHFFQRGRDWGLENVMLEYYVYIMTSRSGTLYTGVTNNLFRRVEEHKRHTVRGFTAKYNIERLVYCESTDSIESAIVREKQIKGWRRERKVALIESINPEWYDLSLEWADNDIDKRALKPVFRQRDSSRSSE
jgi:putative endonuclease